MNSLINDMISQLAFTRETMTKQCNTIGDIMEKSNHVLLQTESTHSLASLNAGHPFAKEELGVPHTYEKAARQAMANVLIKSQTTLKNSDAVTKRDETHNNNNIAQYLQNNRVRAELLGRTVRKFIAIRDMVAKMKASVVEHEAEDDEQESDDEEDNDDNSADPYEGSPP